MKAWWFPATRTPKLLKDVPVVIRVITGDEMSRIDVGTVRDVLEMELPGIEFTNLGGTANIDMQGMGAGGVLFLIDGERIAGQTHRNVDSNRLNLENVERIEILRGAASALYGSNALGGVVNIITKEARQPWEVNMNSGWSDGDLTYGATVGIRQGRVGSLTTATIKTVGSAILTDTELPFATTYIDGFKDTALNQKFNIRAADRLSMVMRGGYYHQEHLNGAAGTGANAGANLSCRLGEGRQVEVHYHYDRFEMHRGEGNYDNGQHTGRVQYNHALGENGILVVGGEFFGESLTTHHFADGGEHSTGNYIGYAQLDYRLTPLITLLGGGRFDLHSVYGGHATPKLAAMAGGPCVAAGRRLTAQDWKRRAAI